MSCIKLFYLELGRVSKAKGKRPTDQRTNGPRDKVNESNIFKITGVRGLILREKGIKKKFNFHNGECQLGNKNLNINHSLTDRQKLHFSWTNPEKITTILRLN